MNVAPERMTNEQFNEIARFTVGLCNHNANRQKPDEVLEEAETHLMTLQQHIAYMCDENNELKAHIKMLVNALELALACLPPELRDL